MKIDRIGHNRFYISCFQFSLYLCAFGNERTNVSIAQVEQANGNFCQINDSRDRLVYIYIHQSISVLVHPRWRLYTHTGG